MDLRCQPEFLFLSDLGVYWGLNNEHTGGACSNNKSTSSIEQIEDSDKRAQGSEKNEM